MGLENIRQLKFRYVLYYKETKVLSYVYRTLEHIENTKVFPLSNEVQVIAKNQYTNVNDKDQKDLYEHDIVKLTMPKNKKTGQSFVIVGEIRWQYGGFIIDSFCSGNRKYPLSTVGELEKIGDAYNNNSVQKTHGRTYNAQALHI